jgi:hypothetical protein
MCDLFPPFMFFWGNDWNLRFWLYSPYNFGAVVTSQAYQGANDACKLHDSHMRYLTVLMSSTVVGNTQVPFPHPIPHH